jgi:AraC family transcriptional regulator
MQDSAHEKHATAFGPSSFARYQSVVPPEFEPGAPPEIPIHTEFRGTRPLFVQTAPAAEGIVHISPADAVSRRTARWPGMEVEIVEAKRRGRIHYRHCAHFPMLVLHDRGVRYDGCTVIDGLPQATLQNCSRVFVPAGCNYDDWHEQRTLSRVMFFHLNPADLAISPELRHSILSLAPRLFFENSALIQTASKLQALIESGDADRRRYIEALGVVLTYELVRVNVGNHAAEAPVNRGLVAWKRRKALAYIEEHIAEPIPLAALAQLVGLSASYFCRAFSESVGLPPQRYQFSQRIERARQLLANQFASVTDVGLTVGYSDASAFCTAFRRATGLSPTAYRRNIC